MGKPLCDLCGELHPTWEFPARDFLVVMEGAIVSQSVAGWDTCDTCHDLLEAGETEKLATRCLDQYLGEHTDAFLDVDSILAMVHDIHRQFFANRTGPPARLEVIA